MFREQDEIYQKVKRRICYETHEVFNLVKTYTFESSTDIYCNANLTSLQSCCFKCGTSAVQLECNELG